MIEDKENGVSHPDRAETVWYPWPFYVGLILIILSPFVVGWFLSGGWESPSGRRANVIANFLAELEGGIEDYRIDHGIYPLNPMPGETGFSWNDELAQKGGAILYQALSGDWDLDGEVDAGATVYVEKLDFSSQPEEELQTGFPPKRSERYGDGFRILDPFGSPIRYLSQAPGISASSRKTRNPTYDLWGILPGKNPDDESAWISNWQRD